MSVLLAPVSACELHWVVVVVVIEGEVIWMDGSLNKISLACMSSTCSGNLHSGTLGVPCLVCGCEKVMMPRG